MLFIALIWALAVSDGGLGILARWGIKKQKTQTVTGICTRVEIAAQLDGLKHVDMKGYSIQLSNGEVYRLNATDLKEIGITDEKLKAFEGSVLTVEYIDICFSVYPLLSLEAERETLIPKGFALQQWDVIWGSTHLLLAFFGGIGILILLCDNLPPLIRSKRKKIRLRRKKLRRQQQLKRKFRKEP